MDEILLPGERGNRLAAQRLVAGSIPVEANLLGSLRAVAAKLDGPLASTLPSNSQPGPNAWDCLDVATKLVCVCVVIGGHGGALKIGSNRAALEEA